METLNAEYWSQRYKENRLGWDIGHVSTPLKDFFDLLSNKCIDILIPGAGNAYEAEYLFKNGFQHITVLDWAQEPLDNLKKRVPDFPEKDLICEDFFKHEGKYDIIVEQNLLLCIASYVKE